MRTAAWLAACALPMGGLASETGDHCRLCHTDALTLEHRDVADLTATLRDIVAGRAEHPLPFPPLSDDDIVALARELTSP